MHLRSLSISHGFALPQSGFALHQNGFALQQKTCRGKDIGNGMFRIVQGYLELSDSGSAAEAARDIAWLASEKESHELEGFLWSVWGDLISIVEQIPFDNPAQDKLVRLLRELTLLPDKGIRILDARLWADLPVLHAQMREALNGPRKAGASEDQAEFDKAWVNFNAFFARLSAAGVVRSENHSIWMLRAALEEDVTKDLRLLDCHIMTAAQIIEYNGPILNQQTLRNRELDETEARMYRGGSLFGGRPGLSPERWRFWISRFRELADHTTAETAKTGALRAARLMEIWQDC